MIWENMLNFNEISIRGRYIYCFLCLKSIIKYKALEVLPQNLERSIIFFTNARHLDLWQEQIDEIKPKRIDSIKKVTFFSDKEFEEIKEYYKRQPNCILDSIETLFELGTSNLYGGFNSSITMEYLDDMLTVLEKLNIPFPPFHLIKNFPVMEEHGWGSIIDISTIDYDQLL